MAKGTAFFVAMLQVMIIWAQSDANKGSIVGTVVDPNYTSIQNATVTVLNAETQVLTARQSMVDIQTSLAVSRVTLLLAVGGSFDARAAGDRTDARTPATSTEATSKELVTRIDP